MIAVQRGDHLPTVALTQVLLNARTDNPLVVDGSFGPITERAVRQFQSRTACSNANGRVNNPTWGRLNQGANFGVEDVIDITDPALREDLRVIQRYNPSPIIIGGMSNAVEAMVSTVVNQFPNQSLVLLRFDGHGTSGLQGVSGGRGSRMDVFGTNRPRLPEPVINEMLYLVDIYSSISSRDIGLDYIEEFLRRLRPCFSVYGSIEFHGCNVARGPDGRQFLRDVSEIVGVPVSASASSQLMGTVQRFTGHVHTGFPNGQNLLEWSRALPSLNMSLP